VQLTVTGHHLAVSPELRKYVDKKLRRLERHFDNMTDIHCVLTVEKAVHKAEATVHISGGTLYAAARETDAYAAIDGLVAKLSRQVTKHKEKITDHHARDAEKSRYR
jgi:putative sigma-54 modulation protein